MNLIGLTFTEKSA